MTVDEIASAAPAPTRLRTSARSTCARVLVATDGTEASRRTLAVAARLFGAGDVTVVTVIDAQEDPMASAGGFEGPALTEEESRAMYREDRVTAEATLRMAAAAFGVGGARRAILEHRGEGIGARLCAAADDLDADVLVVGSRGRSSIADVLTGSVSNYVTHHSNRPVLVIRPDRS
ncbi:MAG: universal stress protein [Acidimicrobiia bacterium]